MKKEKYNMIFDNYNNIDFIGLDTIETIPFPNEFEINVEEFNYHLKTIIASYQNLINLTDFKKVQNNYGMH